jgi:hypothetical protein
MHKKSRKMSRNYLSVEVDVELDELYSDMDTKSCKEMAKWLNEDGFLEEYKGDSIIVDGGNMKLSHLQKDFANKMIDLIPKFHSMDNEETEFIEKLYLNPAIGVVIIS